MDPSITVSFKGAGIRPDRDSGARFEALDYDRHRTVDDRPFGGGEGMVLKPGPLFEAVESIWPERRAATGPARDSVVGSGPEVRSGAGS